MNEFFKWLSIHPAAAASVVISLAILVLTVASIYIVAFLQGRSISFWPPKIGEHPKTMDQKTRPDERHDRSVQTGSSPSNLGRSLASPVSPIIQRGTVLTSASGARIVIESDCYAGANATLFRAKDLLSGLVIVKVFWRGLIPGSKPWDLFNQEQRAAEILTHRNIVKISSRGIHSGYPFIVLEYFAGGTLRDWLVTHNRIPGADILSIAGQVADAIDFAHSRGVIHRDIKPGNILFESDPQSRVALGDFGIARIFADTQKDTTDPGGVLVGSPGYLAPEIMLGRDAEPASDIYSFGVVLYEMIAGKIPFDDHHELLALLRAKIDHDAEDIRALRPGVPKGIAERLAQTLSRTAIDRPKSARSVLAELEGQIRQL